MKKSDIINGIRLYFSGMGLPEACALYNVLSDREKEKYYKIYDNYKTSLLRTNYRRAEK